MFTVQEPTYSRRLSSVDDGRIHIWLSTTHHGSNHSEAEENQMREKGVISSSRVLLRHGGETRSPTFL